MLLKGPLYPSARLRLNNLPAWPALQERSGSSMPTRAAIMLSPASEFVRSAYLLNGFAPPHHHSASLTPRTV